jgi:hypothetical protein
MLRHFYGRAFNFPSRDEGAGPQELVHLLAGTAVAIGEFTGSRD